MTYLKHVLISLLCAAFCAGANAAQSDQDRATVVRWYEAFDQNSPSVLDQILSDDWEDIPAAKGQAAGPAGAKAVLEHLHGSFSDFSIKVEEVLQDGNKVIVRSRISGIQTGVFLGRAPTHRRIDIRATDIHEINAGKIVRTWHMEDWMTGLHQLGVLEP
ncbi:ester cyclase [Pseudomonas sp. PDNC002]|uniref:ester cyclase n=1 Tax=Pseudomonas sp. PDNC002 TaxID=2811422 RepID=UPI0019669EDA|nr:ester cyclase [Pseudomonas sp. PDNC002]QRY77752.1 ester cyclase [Pseudomonas sp. PDNC002]